MEGIRNTKQKEKIISYLNKNPNKHLSIKQIVDGLNNEIGTTTVYRMVNKLVEEGKIAKIPLTDKQGFCYQFNQKQKHCKEHYHLICEDCGKLVHFESETFENTEKEALKKENFSIDKAKIVFYGKCKKCENRKENK